MTSTIPVRIPDKWRAFLEKQAKSEDRSVSSVIRRLIKEGGSRLYGLGWRDVESE